jgi:hypothetical protein
MIYSKELTTNTYDSRQLHVIAGSARAPHPNQGKPPYTCLCVL